MTTKIEKIYGLFFGGALGDSLGLATEFLTRETVEEFYGKKDFQYSEFYPDDFRKWWKSGDWTDDTDQMLILCDILTRIGVGGGLSSISDIELQSHFAEKLNFWRWNGHPELGQTSGVGVGNGVRWVMNEPTFLSHPQEAAKIVWKDTGKSLCEDGCIMRTSLLGLVPDLETSFRLTRLFCMATHYHPVALACCIAVVAMVHAIVIDGVTDCDRIIDYGKSKAIEEMKKHPDYKDKYERIFVKYYKIQTLLEMKLDYGPYMSHVKKPFKCTLWALRQTKNVDISGDFWKNTVFDIIRMGGDADTNSCVAGSVLGALVGYNNLPRNYIRQMNNSTFLAEKCFYFMQSINRFPDSWIPHVNEKIYIVNKKKYVGIKMFEFSKHINSITIVLGQRSFLLEKGDVLEWWGFGTTTVDTLYKNAEKRWQYTLALH